MDFIGDPKSTPFVYFVGGCPVFPPNTLQADAHHVLNTLAGDSSGAFFSELVKSDLVAGVHTVTPEAAWFGYLRDFLQREQGITTDANRQAVVRLCADGEVSERWLALKAFLIQEIDEVSGWRTAWQRKRAEERAIWRAGDKYYYFEQNLGQVVRVLGSTTADETRLQFITDEILKRYGRVRRILDMFSVFVVAEDFTANPDRYPLSLRLVAWTPEWGISIPPDWHFSQYIRVRTLKWRPDNNLCDPDWLANQLLAEITDDIDRDLWREAIEVFQKRPDLLEDLPYQLDYVLETNLAIGEQPEGILEFEGRKFRWINGTIESKPLLSVRCTGTNEVKQTGELVDRFLSALAWQSGVSISKAFGAGGPKRIVPIVSGSRRHGGLLVTPDYALPKERFDSPQAQLGIALFREGLNAVSPFYKFLSFWKILELVFPKRKDCESWIVLAIPSVVGGTEWLNEIATEPLEYLRESCRNAISHVHHEPVTNPDNYDDKMRLERDVRIVEGLARAAINSGQLT